MPNDSRASSTRARTGSNALVDRLKTCPDVTCRPENFFKPRPGIDIDRAYPPPAAERADRRARRRPLDVRPPGSGARPAEPRRLQVFPPHVDSAPGAIAHIAAPATRRIVLTRAPLETYASFLRMRATGVHKLKEGEPRRPRRCAAKVRFAKSDVPPLRRRLQPLPGHGPPDRGDPGQLRHRLRPDQRPGRARRAVRLRRLRWPAPPTAPPPSASSSRAASRTASRTGARCRISCAPTRTCSPPRRRAIGADQPISAWITGAIQSSSSASRRELREAPVRRVRSGRRLEEQRLAPEEAPRRRAVRGREAGEHPVLRSAGE